MRKEEGGAPLCTEERRRGRAVRAHAKGKGETTDCVAAAAVLQAWARSQGGKRMAPVQSGSSSSDTKVTHPGLVLAWRD